MDSGDSPKYVAMGRGARLKGILKVKQDRDDAVAAELATSLEEKASVQEQALVVAEAPKVKLPVKARGSSGKPNVLVTNYLSMGFEEGRGLYEYKVTFSPTVDEKTTRFKVLGKLGEKIGGNKMFDGHFLLIPFKWAEEDKHVKIPEDVDGKSYEVTFEFLGKKEATDTASIHLFNAAIKRTFKALSYSHIRNGLKDAFFDAAAANVLASHKLQVWPGYSTTVQAYEEGVLLEIDTCSKVMHTETAHDIISDLVKRNPSSFQDSVRKELIGSSVITKYNNRSYRITDIDFTSSPANTFATSSGGDEISFTKYYASKYNASIKDEGQPMLVSLVKKRERPEEDPDKVLLVPELCLVVGMTDRQREDFRVMKDVANFTRLPPKEKERAMANLLTCVAKNDLVQGYLKAWGITLSPKLVCLEGRTLEPERLFFGRGYSELVTSKVEWGRTATSKCVLQPKDLTKWSVVVPEKDKAAVRNFCSVLKSSCSRVGINAKDPQPVIIPNDRIETYIKAIRSLDPDTQMVVTVVNAQKADRYAAIKKLCYVERPMASQVVLLKNLTNEKKAGPVAQKVALQINCKMGGELWACKTPFTGLMVVGIEVYREKGAVAYASLVASINDVSTRFYSAVAKHSGDGATLALELGELLKKAVLAYFSENKRWPSNIVVFRDGLGYNELENAGKKEAAHFNDLLETIRTSEDEGAGAGYNFKPSFNYIVVQKRINTRIFKETAQGQGFDNPLPGTVVDHTVTLRYFKDFFLVSQNVNHGTVSPVHFIVVSETGSSYFSVDSIQKLAYQLTHMYFNWCGTVKVPAHVQYAKKLVDMTGDHLRAIHDESLNTKLFYL